MNDKDKKVYITDRMGRPYLGDAILEAFRMYKAQGQSVQNFAYYNGITVEQAEVILSIGNQKNEEALDRAWSIMHS